jgi:TetR/AcrR family transcriptional repressor of lmrAB and yxaGH operons
MTPDPDVESDTQLVIETASRLFQHHGFGDTSLARVFEEISMTQQDSDLLFPGGKEQVGVEALARASVEMVDLIYRLSRVSDVDAVALVQGLGGELADALERSNFASTSVMSTITLDAAATSDPLRLACNAAYHVWQHALKDALSHKGLSARRADALALNIIAALEGAVILSRSRRNTKPISVVVQELSALLGQEIKSLPTTNRRP